jgi:hypothetical protein
VVFGVIVFGVIILFPTCVDPAQGPVPDSPGVPLGFEFEKPYDVIEMMVLVRSEGWITSAVVSALIGLILGLISFGVLKFLLR